jgi:hypothetical protein
MPHIISHEPNAPFKGNQGGVKHGQGASEEEAGKLNFDAGPRQTSRACKPFFKIKIKTLKVAAPVTKHATPYQRVRF